MIESKLLKGLDDLKEIRKKIEDLYFQIYKLSIDPKVTKELD
jgi:hypothetical protein